MFKPLFGCALGAWLLVASGGVAQAQDAGFASLFNGKDFTGWRFSGQKDGDPWPENWKVKDGVIFLTGGGKPHLRCPPSGAG